MQKDYSHYTAEDLLQDDFFLQYVLHPSPEDIRFWEDEMQRTPSLVSEIQYAHILVKCLHPKREELSPTEVSDMWSNILRTGKGNRHRIYRLLSVAAGMALLLGISLFWIGRQASENPEAEIALVHRPEINGSDVQLILVDNQSKRIEGKEVALCYTGNGTVKIDADAVDVVENQKTAENPQTPVYNQLIVPYGKRSSVTLSDGTKIWVNANSRVVFPVEFAADKREIYVEGEVFLEVARDEKHPFFVRTKMFDVNVLGTSFDVMAYPENYNPAVVLVTGKVNVTTKEGRQIELKPNDRLEWEKGETVVKSVEVYDYIAWKDGLCRFESAPFGIVLDRLSRYYGTTIKYDGEVAGMSCSGKLDLKDNLTELLDGLVKILPIRYDITGDSVRISAEHK